MNKHTKANNNVAFFPSLKAMSGNPYWTFLADSLQKSGINFHYETPDIFTFRWLLTYQKHINLLHLHYCQQFYSVHKGRTHLPSVLRYAFNLILARTLGFRIVFTLHNLEPTYSLEPIWLDYLGHWLTINLANSVIVHCDYARYLLAERYGRRHKVFVVEHPNCVNWYPNTVSKEEARKILNIPDNCVVFLFFGGVRPNKGIELVIEALKKIKNDNFRLIIAGKIFPPESYSYTLQELARGDNRIIFNLHHILDNEIQVFMNAADTVVLPFTRILTSSSTNLAMSFSRPVIVPKMGCLAELVESEVGWVFDIGNVNSLISAMISASMSDLPQIGKNAFEKILPKTSEHFAQETIYAYWT